MNDPYVGQTVDVILGQEYLTWLWFRSESSPLGFVDGKKQPFTVALDQRVVVQGGEGPSRETTSVSGSPMVEDGFHLPLREARLGMCTGKKVTRALLRFEQNELTWQVTVKAEDLSLNTFRCPKVEHEKDDDPDAIFLEKLFLTEQCLDLLDRTFKAFLEVRLSGKWEAEAKDMGKWMTRQE